MKSTPKTRSSAYTLFDASVLMKDIELGDFTEDALKIYGEEVNLNRSVADFRDGMKPVQRRVLWALSQLPKPPQLVKTARLIGDTMGKFHPHGDCLRGDTLVYTLDGNFTPIKDLIGVGKKWVLAYDSEKADYVPALAHSWRVGQTTSKVYTVHLSDGSTINCTGNHPFLTKSGDWVKASDLLEDTELRASALFHKEKYMKVSTDTRCKAVHSLVSLHKNGDLEDGEVVHHENEIQHDNRPRNLKVITRSEHQAEHLEHALKGLANGHETMFSGEDRQYRRAIRKKNSSLMKTHNEWLWLLKSIKVARHVRDVIGVELTESSYESSRGIVYNCTKVETLVKKGISWEMLADYVDNWKIPTDHAKGLTKKVRKLRREERKDSLPRDLRKMQESGYQMKLMEVVRFSSKYESISSLTWSDIGLYRELLIRRLLKKYGAHSKATPARSTPKVSTFKRFGPLRKQIEAASPAFGVFVLSVTLTESSVKEPMYDFTVDGYENMMIVSKQDDSSSTLVCVHNSSISGAIETLVVAPTNTVRGVGGWGSIIDRPGAPRYTNLLLSDYGQTFFHKHYTGLMDLVPSYDDKDVEPLTLPALLPNLLLNGSEGIGLGLTTRIPAFTPATLLPLLADLADGTEVTPQQAAKRLEFYHQYGGVVPKNKESLQKITTLLESTSGSVRWTSPYEVDRDRKQIKISAFAPEINPIRLVEDKLKGSPQVASVHSGKGVSYIIQVNKSLNYVEFDAFVKKFEVMVTSNINYQIYITYRKLVDGRARVRFANLTLMKLMALWVDYRIKLEKASLTARIAEEERRQRRLELLIRAHDCLDIIFRALKSTTPKELIMRGMEISAEDADYILDLKARQLTKLDQEALKEQVKTCKENIRELRILLKKPAQVVSEFLRKAAANFVNKVNDCSRQYEMQSRL